MNKTAIGILIVVLALAGVFAVTQKPAQKAMEETPVVNTMPAGDATGVDEMMVGGDAVMPENSGNVQSFTVNGSEFAYDINEITVKKGDTVEIVFNNREGFHDWVLDEFNAQTAQLAEGESETITFVADKTGTFEYYCSVGKHRQMGMVGILTVTE